MNIFKTFSIFFIPFFISINFSSGQTNNSNPFNLDFTREAVILGTGTAAGITAILIFNNIDALTNEEINSLNRNDVSGFDRIAIGMFAEDHFGDGLLYSAFLLPVSFLAFEETEKDFFDLVFMYGEVLLIQSSITGIVKGTVLRTRPYVYDENSPMNKKTAADARVSFFSGHVSSTAAITFFTARVFSEYVQGNTARILIWSGTIIYPALVGILRMNKHWHFPTDVITGYTIGALVGYFIPELHKNKLGDSVSIYPSININQPTLSLQIKF